MIYFFRTRYDYGSYTDFHKLVTLSGFPLVYADELRALDKPDNVYIGNPLNGEWHSWRKGELQGKLILYNLEYNIDNQHNIPECVDETWFGDAAHARQHGFRYVPLGGHGGLREDYTGNIEKNIDVSQIAYQVYRRAHITNEMKALGLRLGSNENLWGIDRTKELLNSKTMVHVMQWDNVPAIAPLRWCIAAAHSLPMITETVEDRGIFGHTYMMQSDYEHLPAFVAQVVKKGSHYQLDDYGRALHDLLCNRYTFRRMIESNL